MGTVINIKPITSQDDAELIKAGWQKQTTLDERRLREVAVNYLVLGYEVFVQEFRNEEGCTSCFGTGQEMGNIYGTVWIRPGTGVRQDDELFDE
jgi:hypothetical protein